MLTLRQRKITLFGYLLLLASFLGFYSIYLDRFNEGSHWFVWVSLMLIGGGIVGWKNLQFTRKKQWKLVFLDLIFILNFYLFSMWNLKYGLNYLISGLIGALLIFFIDYKYLSQKG